MALDAFYDANASAIHRIVYIYVRIFVNTRNTYRCVLVHAIAKGKKHTINRTANGLGVSTYHLVSISPNDQFKKKTEEIS